MYFCLKTGEGREGAEQVPRQGTSVHVSVAADTFLFQICVQMDRQTEACAKTCLKGFLKIPVVFSVTAVRASLVGLTSHWSRPVIFTFFPPKLY